MYEYNGFNSFMRIRIAYPSVKLMLLSIFVALLRASVLRFAPLKLQSDVMGFALRYGNCIVTDTMRLKTLRSVSVMITFILVITLCIVFLQPGSDFVVVDVIAKENLIIRDKLKSILKCIDKSFELEKLQDGSFWILKNYIRAEHGELSCGQSITYTTHGDFTFLVNLPVLIPRWNAPISLALYSPGYDFRKTMESIQYVRNCLPNSKLIQYYVTFHIYFAYEHIPQLIPLTEAEALKWPYNCSVPPPYRNVNRTTMYRYMHNLQYPINVGRNIARKAAITHFILACDIELYPSPGFVVQFLAMVKRNASILYGDRPRVFPLVVFEVEKWEVIPETKTELQSMLRNKSAIPFHNKLCRDCHKVPNLDEWILANETNDLDVFAVGQRTLKYKYWEPFYVSDNEEPLFDERVTWEGQKNKRIQSFAMCLLDYEFHVLNNAFLVHSPGIKVYKRDVVREKYIRSMNALIRNDIIPEYQILFGKRRNCDP